VKDVFGNLTFPLDEELPLDLVGRVAIALAARYAALCATP